MTSPAIWAGHDWRLVPSAVACWLGTWIGTAGWYPSPLLLTIIGVSLSVVAVLARRWWLRIAVLVLIAAATLAGLRAWQVHHGPASYLANGPCTAVTVRLAEEPRVVTRAGRSFIVVKVELTEYAVPAVVLGDQDALSTLSAAQPGAIHQVTGEVTSADPTGAEAVMIRADVVSPQLVPPDLINRVVTAIHMGLREATAHSPPDQAALVPSLVVGDRSRITDQLNEEFKATSLSHLLAVSGSNLTLMLGVLLVVARGAGLRGWVIRGVAVAGVAAFVLVCRAEPSVLRAAAMGLVALSALGLSRDHRSIRNLSIAVLTLLPFDPYLARSWGFALSVAACLGITLGAGPLTHRMVRWAPELLAEAIAVPLSAQLATMPLVTAMSGQVSGIGVFANALAGPFIGPATVLGLAAALVTPFPWLAVIPAWLAGWVVQPILWVAHVGAAAPQGVWQAPGGLAGAAVGTLLGGAVAALTLWGLQHRWSALGLAILLIIVSWMRLAPAGWPGPWLMIFCDVGQGDATVLRTGPDSAVLVDAGPEPGPTEECLEAAGVQRLDAIVLTHFHADHVGGFQEVMTRYRAPLVVVSPLPSPEDAARQVRITVADQGARLIEATPGQHMHVGELTWFVVAAWRPSLISADGEGESSAENDSSVISVAQVGGLRALLPGDAEPNGQRRALASSGVSLEAQVLKLPHHGSSRQEERFLAAPGASLAVVSAGEGNSFGHPATRTLELVMSQGMTVARTDTQGHIAVSMTDGQLAVRNWRST